MLGLPQYRTLGSAGVCESCGLEWLPANDATCHICNSPAETISLWKGLGVGDPPESPLIQIVTAAIHHFDIEVGKQIKGREIRRSRKKLGLKAEPYKSAWRSVLTAYASGQATGMQLALQDDREIAQREAKGKGGKRRGR